MTALPRVLCGAIILAGFVGTPPVQSAALRTSLGITAGTTVPVGWWAKRWDPGPSAEANLRYEFAPGTGILVLSGVSKVYFTELPAGVIYGESSLRATQPDFVPYTTIVRAVQGGAFKQVSAGFGFYLERLVLGQRMFGSLAFTVQNWKFQRDQYLEVEQSIPELGSEPVRRTDVWWTEQDGSDLGAQVGLGIVRPLFRKTLLEVSTNYHYVDISRKHGSLAYWGYPARTGNFPSGGAPTGRVDYLQFRVGLRYGR